MTKSRGIRATRGSRQAWVAENQGLHHCRCGCGGEIKIRPTHFSKGVPRYLLGHNPDGRAAGPVKPSSPCACGCGELAKPGRQYVHGHQRRGKSFSPETLAHLSEVRKGREPWNKQPPKPPTPCECGCGEMASPGRRFISGHNGRGQRLPNYTGRYKANGYVLLFRPDHPFCNIDGYIGEHRVVLEDRLRAEDPTSPYLMKLGERLYLRKGTVTHHRNGVKDDNRPENLEALTVAEHTRLHHQRGDIRK